MIWEGRRREAFPYPDQSPPNSPDCPAPCPLAMELLFYFLKYGHADCFYWLAREGNVRSSTMPFALPNLRGVRIILLEFNELCPSLLDRFIDAGELPNFSQLREQSQAFVTTTDEPLLEPWIQWVTVHTGVPMGVHRLHELDQGYLLSQETIWECVSRAGYPVLVCGAMNVSDPSSVRGVVLPDPWTTRVPPKPVEMVPFFEFVRRQVLKHTERDRRMDVSLALRFVRFMVAHGLSISSIRDIAVQLALERFGSCDVRWRRATILDSLQWDLFSYLYRRLDPALSIFFANSTAHFQHQYWRHMEPQLFDVKPSAGDIRSYSKAILFGYKRMDKLLGAAFRMAGTDVAIGLCTGLSQQPCLKYESIGGKAARRPRNLFQFFKFCGITEDCKPAPVMAEVFCLYCDDDATAIKVQTKLLSLTLQGEQVIQCHRSGGELQFKCRLHGHVDEEQWVRSGTGETVKFGELFYTLDVITSGMHHRDGVFWLRIPGMAGRTFDDRLPITRISDILRESLDIDVPVPHTESASHIFAAG